MLNNWRITKDVPDETSLSKIICKDMKERGFTFIDSKIIYAFMQAIGMINDHPVYCFLSITKMFRKKVYLICHSS